MSIGYILLRNTEKGMYMHILVYIEPKKKEESKWNRKNIRRYKKTSVFLVCQENIEYFR